ncbi:unnamed protein product, partial [Ectocarpus sp. 12 AP-2014]
MIAPSNLRDRMRQDSRRVHRELDASLGRFDLREPADLTAFFRILERGYAALGTGRGAGAKLAADLARHLRADLAVLGASPLPAAPALPPDAESLAIDYV